MKFDMSYLLIKLDLMVQVAYLRYVRLLTYVVAREPLHSPKTTQFLNTQCQEILHRKMTLGRKKSCRFLTVRMCRVFTRV